MNPEAAITNLRTEALLGRVEVKARYGDATPANEAVDRIRLQAPSLLGDAS